MMGLSRSFASILLLIGGWMALPTVDAFVPMTSLTPPPTATTTTPSNTRTIQTRVMESIPLSTSTRRRRNSRLAMASSSSSSSPWTKFELPPPPEDTLTMSGDILSLFLYSFLDHSAHEKFLEMMATDGVSATMATMDPFGEYSFNTQIPVWFDALHSLVDQEQLLTWLSLEHIGYAPVLSTAGLASIVLSTCWLLAGYVTSAFSYSNTLECNTSRMLYVTGKTWVLSTTLVVVLALLSDQVGCHCLQQPSLAGLTKADADYIFDSLTVLITWRFMISLLTGGATKK